MKRKNKKRKLKRKERKLERRQRKLERIRESVGSRFCPLDGSACDYVCDCEVRLVPCPDEFVCFRESKSGGIVTVHKVV